jgi:redox-sensitive bicupin YhaK (pirin superfamily)
MEPTPSRCQSDAMSNPDVRPDETLCRRPAVRGPVNRLLDARKVPLGGIRAMRVRRTLPTRDLPLVGAWCFLDAFGPEHVDMRVLPHPHTGLQTVTWPLVGEIRHRDSLGNDVVVRPGQLNLMTAGHGVSHSELSVGTARLLHGVQLWIALPAAEADSAPRFEQHLDLPVVSGEGVRATVLVGELAGSTSGARVLSPLLGADVSLDPATTTTLPLRAGFEHAVLGLEGQVAVDGTELVPGPLLYLGAGRDHVSLASATGGRVLLVGGEPFADDLVMWWNFVGRSHDAIVKARRDWEEDGPARYGTVPGHGAERIPAPALPNLRLTPRRRRDGPVNADGDPLRSP